MVSPNQRRFSRTGGGEDIDDQKPARPEEAAVAFGQAVVLLQDGVAQLQRLAFFRAGFVRMMMRMRRGRGRDDRDRRGHGWSWPETVTGSSRRSIRSRNRSHMVHLHRA